MPIRGLPALGRLAAAGVIAWSCGAVAAPGCRVIRGAPLEPASLLASATATPSTRELATLHASPAATSTSLAFTSASSSGVARTSAVASTSGGASASGSALASAFMPRFAPEEGAPTVAEVDIDRALDQPTAAGSHTAPRYDLGGAPTSSPSSSADLPLLVRLYLRVPGAQVRACEVGRGGTGALRYYPIAPVWRSPSGLCHFSLQGDEDNDLLARPEHDIDQDEAWRYQLFTAQADRCDGVELERYVETAGVSDRDLATFFRMWRAFAASPVRFETALRRFELSAPDGLWRPPAEIELLSQAREHLRIVSVVNEREGDGLLDRLSDGVAGPRLGVRFARVGGGDPWFDVRLGWGTMSLLGFRARED